MFTLNRYKENVAEASKLFKDRPQTPIETAIFWTEYVLRHNDTSSLKPIHCLEQFWFQRRLLDVWAFIILSFFAIIYLLYFVTKKIGGCICGRRTNVEKSRGHGRKVKKS